MPIAIVSKFSGHLSKKETFQGIWSKKESLLHINVLEMEAVMLSIHVQHFLPKLVSKNVLIRLDNSTVVRCINKQGVFWTRYLEKSLFCLGDPRTRFWKRLLSELSMYFMELWTCSCLDFPGSTTILDDFLKVSKKELLLPEFDQCSV
jgi:hypothetical protein